MGSPSRFASVPMVVLVVVTMLVLFFHFYVTGFASGLGVSMPPEMWLMALLYALYVTAFLLVCAAAVAYLRRRSPPPVPLLPARWQTHRTTYLVLGTFVVLLTILREGAFAPTCMLTYDVPITRAEIHLHPSDTHIATKDERPPDVMAGRPVHCKLDCVNPDSFCEAIVTSLSCVEQEPAPGTVVVRGTVLMDPGFGPACYLPLYKRNRGSFHAELELDLQTARTETTASFSVDVTLDKTYKGPLSCHGYQGMVARMLAEQLAKVLQDGLNEN